MLLVSGLLAAGPASADPLAEAWVDVNPGDTSRLSTIPGIGIAEDRRGGQVRVLLEPGAIERLRNAGWSVSGIRADHRTALPPGYHTPAEGSLFLHDRVDRAARAGFVNFGTSVEGRPIDGLWLGQEPAQGAPTYRILAGHHGDEVTSVEVALALVDRLVSEDGRDPAITSLLDRSTVWIVPYVNPDGVADGSRVNHHGVDLNRNYDVAWNESTLRPGPHPFSEPETRAIRAFATFDRPVASLSLHAGAANLGWPWNYTTDRPADDAELVRLARIYSEACRAPGFWTTQGADWYVTYGDTNDWAYGRYGVLDFTLEVSEVRAPPAAELPGVADWHIDAILAFLSEAPNLAGTVVDATGNPVEATLRFGERSGPFLADPTTGAFRRIVPPGRGTLTAEAEGYAPVAIDLDRVETDLRVVMGTADFERAIVEPSVLRSPRTVRVDRDGPLGLVRPDADPVEAEVRDGVLSIDPTALAPGWWTFAFPDGSVWPRALLVEAAEAVVVDGWRIDTDRDTLWIDGAGFAEGARAWAVWGVARVPVEVPVVQVADEALQLDVSAIPTDARADLAVWTAGGIVGLDDLWNPRRLGTDDPYEDEALIAVSGCACRSAVRRTSEPRGVLRCRSEFPSSGIGWMLIAALVAVRRRSLDLAKHAPRL